MKLIHLITLTALAFALPRFGGGLAAYCGHCPQVAAAPDCHSQDADHKLLAACHCCAAVACEEDSGAAREPSRFQFPFGNGSPLPLAASVPHPVSTEIDASTQGKPPPSPVSKTPLYVFHSAYLI